LQNASAQLPLDKQPKWEQQSVAMPYANWGTWAVMMAKIEIV
jgi:hypothetical protein